MLPSSARRYWSFTPRVVRSLRGARRPRFVPGRLHQVPQHDLRRLPPMPEGAGFFQRVAPDPSLVRRPGFFPARVCTVFRLRPKTLVSFRTVASVSAWARRSWLHPARCVLFRLRPRTLVSDHTMHWFLPAPEGIGVRQRDVPVFPCARGRAVPPARFARLSARVRRHGFRTALVCTDLIRRPRAPLLARTDVLVRLMRVAPLSALARRQWFPLAYVVRSSSSARRHWSQSARVAFTSAHVRGLGFPIALCAVLCQDPKVPVPFDAVHRTPPLPEGAGFSLRVALP